MKSIAYAIVGSIAVAIGAVSPAAAQTTGLDGLHSQAREGRKWCMVDHFHTNSGTGADRKTAEREAAVAWQGFTSWEYGNTWGLWRNAASKTMKCEKDGFGSWTCTADARPCRPLAREAGVGNRRGTRRKRR